ncbi:hypothetical protein [Pseudomonas syringae]|uniref:hypothetical protein n=1 Tax=Pseudomonas syringae TaxID=317 RepID=UPI000C071990|nr:hypothetical protein [Pseudomonas syringae]PHN23293.1 hypothetical protein AO256_24790 [Pseudomonas syringae]
MDRRSNIHNRMRWLREILDEGADTPEVKAEDIQSAKEFCRLALKEHFESIAYNTLKAYLLNLPPGEFGMHAFPDNFQYFLELRRRAFEKLDRASGKSKLAESPTDWKGMYRNALWQSNLCSMAYLSLKRDVEAILVSGVDDARLDYRKLEKVVKKSSLVFAKIISQDPENTSPDLKVVQGVRK